MVFVIINEMYGRANNITNRYTQPTTHSVLYLQHIMHLNTVTVSVSDSLSE